MDRMGTKDELRIAEPESYSEELWILQGRVKALEGYLRFEHQKYPNGEVSLTAVANIMGIILPEIKKKTEGE